MGNKVFESKFGKYLFFVFLIFVFWTAAKLSLPGERAEEENYKEIEEIIIADGQQPVFGLIYIAEANGYFDDEGLRVSYRYHDSGKEALDDVIGGGADLATVFNGPVVRGVFEGKDLAVVSTLHSSSGNIILLLNKKMGIHNVGDLKGRRVSVQCGTTAEYVLHSILSVNNIAPEEVDIINLPNEEGLRLFETGKIGAVVSWNIPIIRTINQFNEKDLVQVNSDVLKEYSVLAGKRDFVEQNPTKIRKILRALIRAKGFMKANEAESRSVIGANSGEASDEELEKIWDTIEYKVALDNLLLSSLEIEATWYMKNDIYKNKMLPNFRKIIYSNYLDELSSDYVTIY